jgi:hypothetical protein
VCQNRTAAAERLVPFWQDPALASIKAGKAYYGEVPILGTPYITGYEPIKNGSDVIGVYYVGYKK